MDIIVKDKFKVRKWSLSDAQSLVEARSDETIAKGLYEPNNHPYTIEKALEHIKLSQKENNHQFAITIDDKIAGEIGCIIKDRPAIGNINYWLGKQYRGNGIATEAVDFFTDYIFNKYRVMFMEASVFEWNTKSIKVLEEAGYKRLDRRKSGSTSEDKLYIFRYIKPNLKEIHNQRYERKNTQQ